MQNGIFFILFRHSFVHFTRSGTCAQQRTHRLAYCACCADWTRASIDSLAFIFDVHLASGACLQEYCIWSFSRFQLTHQTMIHQAKCARLDICASVRWCNGISCGWKYPRSMRCISLSCSHTFIFALLLLSLLLLLILHSAHTRRNSEWEKKNSSAAEHSTPNR